MKRLEEYVTSGFVRDGDVRIRNQRGYRRAMARFREGTELVITFARRHATRSLRQNAYYFGVVLKLMSDHTGYTVDELHEWAKQKFNPKRLAFADSRGMIRDEQTIGLTTTKLNKLKFGEFVDDVRQFAAEHLDLVIPDPDPDWADQQMEAHCMPLDGQGRR